MCNLAVDKLISTQIYVYNRKLKCSVELLLHILRSTDGITYSKAAPIALNCRMWDDWTLSLYTI